MSCAPLPDSLWENASQLLSQVGNYNTRIFQPFPSKPVVVGACIAVLHYFGIPTHLVLPLVLICLADLVSGIIKAIKTKTFSSRKLRMVFPKWSTYLTALVALGAGTHFFPQLQPVPEWVMGTIAVTELVSIMENLHCAGFGGAALDKIMGMLQATLKDKIDSDADADKECTPNTKTTKSTD